MKPRTKARSVALQVLYELDIADHNPQLVLVERLEEVFLRAYSGRFCSRYRSGRLGHSADARRINCQACT